VGPSDRQGVDGARLIALYLLVAVARLSYDSGIRCTVWRGLTGPASNSHTYPNSMTYSVKEIFHTLQGEGAQVGRAAVFCRFAGCNLWSGREIDRAKAVCKFCDTEFVGTNGRGGGKFERAADLAEAIDTTWVGSRERKFVVVTGGEPLLQLDSVLVTAIQDRGFEIAVETNGTLDPPAGIDWICVSPKANAPLRLKYGNELKFVYPQKGLDPSDLAELEFDHFWLSPMDGPMRAENTRAAIDYCLGNPKWRLSLQTHKIVGIP
jgi:7-carboxy-7-deazaguanine synthase